MTDDRFLGAWLVTEYVFNPNGVYAGHIYQRRELHSLSNGRIRVTQHCMPSAELNAHPMGKFVGTWVFELEKENQYRRYLGEAVIGLGIEWADGVMTGEGLWPQFGHNFTSFGILATPTRQLTGGKFFNGSEMIANIVGVAEPITHAKDWPTLIHYAHPSEFSTNWQSEDGLRRQYTASGWKQTGDSAEKITVTRAKDADKGQSDSGAFGIGKQVGALWEAHSYAPDGMHRYTLEIFDSKTQQIVGITFQTQDDRRQKVEIIRFRPKLNDTEGNKPQH